MREALNQNDCGRDTELAYMVRSTSCDQYPMAFCDYFCEHFPLPVLGYGHSRFTLGLRFCAFLVVIFAVGITGYQCANQLNQWLECPVSVATQEMYENNATMPAFLVCPANQLRMGKGSEVEWPLELIEMHYSFDKKKYATKNSIKYNFENLSVIVDDLKNIRDNILTSNQSDYLIKRYCEIGEMIKPYFPSIAKKLTISNPAPHGKIYMSDNNNSRTFADYRDTNEYYDDCLRAIIDRENAGIKRITPFEKALIYCRLINPIDFNKGYDIIAFFESLDKNVYHEFVADGQPKQEMIKNCKWSNTECNITNVQTNRGLCFRIAPKDDSASEITNAGNLHAVNFVLDLYSFGTKDTTAMIYFRPHNQTEFSLTEGGIQVKPGRRTTLEISQIRQLSRVDTHCGERQLEHFANYSKENCEWNEAIENIRKNCGCLSNLYPEAKTNTTAPFCSLAQEFGCVRFQNQKMNLTCPNDCTTTSYDIDISTIPIDYKEITDYLPRDWSRKHACLACGYNFYYDKETSPGAIHFEYMINELFQLHLEMIQTFWWRSNEEPYLTAYLHNTTVFGDPVRYPSTSHYEEYLIGEFEILVVVNQLIGTVGNETTRWYVPFSTYEAWMRLPRSLAEYFMDQPNVINFPAFATDYTHDKTNLLQLLDEMLFHLSQELESLDKDLSTVMLNLTALVLRPGALKEPRSTLTAKNMIACMASLKEDIVKIQKNPVLPGTTSQGVLSRWVLDFQNFVEHYLKMYSSGRGYDESNLAQVETYFRSFRRHSTTEEYSYTIWNLLSDIGGALGLWIGATAITVFEMIIIFLKPVRFLHENSVISGSSSSSIRR
uniref:Uncharacterized protein n=1 Tax=Plectus sambesii TaxID=2011161 RepID=A0A914XHH9_9BILA